MDNLFLVCVHNMDICLDVLKSYCVQKTLILLKEFDKMLTSQNVERVDIKRLSREMGAS